LPWIPGLHGAPLLPGLRLVRGLRGLPRLRDLRDFPDFRSMRDLHGMRDSRGFAGVLGIARLSRDARFARFWAGSLRISGGIDLRDFPRIRGKKSGRKKSRISRIEGNPAGKLSKSLGKIFSRYPFIFFLTGEQKFSMMEVAGKNFRATEDNMDILVYVLTVLSMGTDPGLYMGIAPATMRALAALPRRQVRQAWQALDAIARIPLLTPAQLAQTLAALARDTHGGISTLASAMHREIATWHYTASIGLFSPDGWHAFASTLPAATAQEAYRAAQAARAVMDQEHWAAPFTVRIYSHYRGRKVCVPYNPHSN